ncbi:MAG: hypothetical protein Tsb002_01170 [Wenzhouxiangellaceae bacterium]
MNHPSTASTLNEITHLETRVETHVRPSDVDANGHLNNAVTLEFFELGRLNWATVNAVNFDAQVVAVLTEVHVKYLRECVESQVAVITRLIKVGFYELTFTQQLVDVQNPERVFSEGQLKVSIIDRESRKPTRVKRWFAAIDKN